jgi:rfaE bifunctional protein nucleotidyltransferase chain/domain
VAINSDASVRRIKGPERPIIPVEERAEILRSLRCVDEVRIFDDDTPVNLIRQLRPDVLAKGPACKGTTIPGAELVESWGGEVIVPDWHIQRSSTQIITRIRQHA